MSRKENGNMNLFDGLPKVTKVTKVPKVTKVTKLGFKGTYIHSYRREQLCPSPRDTSIGNCLY